MGKAATGGSIGDTQLVSGVEIIDVPAAALDDLQPLWRALYEHQNEVAPHLSGRSRPFEMAWASRRRIERGWLESEPDSFVLAAQGADRSVGYAFVRVRSGVGHAASWSFSDPLAELATLAVLPQCRGRGVGSALMDSVEARVHRMGIADLAVGVIATNGDAIRFYERRGALPFLTELIQPVQPDRRPQVDLMTGTRPGD